MTLEEALAENTTLKASIASLESAQERVNGESKTHRLNAQSFQTQANEFRAKFEAAQQALTDAETKAASDLDKLKLDLTARATAAEAAAAQANEAAQSKVLMAKLQSAAKDAKLGDVNYLKLFDDKADFKVNDDGDLLGSDGKPLDVTAWFDTKKAAMPHLFDLAPKPGTMTGTTATTTTPPRQATSTEFNARTAPVADYDAAERAYLSTATRR